MPTDRLFRYSMSGVVFLLSLIFFFYFFGGNLLAVANWTKNNNFIVPFVALFLSTPAIGLILSTFTFWWLFLMKRSKIHYYVPCDTVILNHVFEKFPEIGISSDRRTESNDWSNKEIDKFYPYYQTQVRKLVTGPSMEYLERRWSVFWIHTNSIFSIVLAAIIMLIVQLCLPGCLCFDPSVFKLIGIIIFVGYCLVANYLSNVAMEHGKSFEHAALKDAIKATRKRE